MKRALLLLLLLTAAARGGAPITVYANVSGSNTEPYNTAAKGAPSILTLMTYIWSSGGDGSTILVQPGTYDSYITINATNQASLTITGNGSVPGDVILTCTTNHVLYSNLTGTVVQNCTIRPATANKYGIYLDGGTITVRNCRFDSASANNYDMFYHKAGDSTVINCKFYQKSSTAWILNGADGNATWQNCMLYPRVEDWYGNGITWVSNDTLNLYNCLIMGARAEALYVTNGTVNATNCIIQGGIGDWTSTSASVRRTGGTVTCTNCQIVSAPYDGDGRFTNGTVTKTNCVTTNHNQEWKSRGRVGYIMFGIDDTTNHDYAVSVADILDNYTNPNGDKFSATYNLTAGDWPNDATHNDLLRALVSGGSMEVACHSLSHTKFTVSTGLDISYSGAGHVSFSGGIITFDQDGSTTDDWTLDTTQAAYDTLGEIAAADQKNWTITLGTDVTAYAKATSLANKGSTAEPTTLDFSKSAYNTGFYKDEVLDPKTTIAGFVNYTTPLTDPQTGTTYACRTFSAPYDLYHTDTEAYILSSRYEAGRGTLSTETTVGYQCHLDDFKLSKHLVWGTIIDGNETSVRQQAAALAQAAVTAGLAITVLEHNTGELSLANWAYVADELHDFSANQAGSGLIVCSYQQFADDVNSVGSAWTNDGDGTYSRAWTTYDDYHMIAVSPLVNAGSNAPGATYDDDFDGRDQDNFGTGWEIGPYVYYTQPPAFYFRRNNQ